MNSSEVKDLLIKGFVSSVITVSDEKEGSREHFFKFNTPLKVNAGRLLSNLGKNSGQACVDIMNQSNEKKISQEDVVEKMTHIIIEELKSDPKRIKNFLYALIENDYQYGTPDKILLGKDAPIVTKFTDKRRKLAPTAIDIIPKEKRKYVEGARARVKKFANSIELVNTNKIFTLTN